MKQEYRLIDRTSEERRCIAGMACPAIYEVEEITPKAFSCFGGLGCPSAFELKRITPSGMQCLTGACPEIYAQNKDSYLIIGEVIDAKDFGLEKRVREGEVLISVPKVLIDKRDKRKK